MKFIVLFAVFIVYLPGFKATFFKTNITDFSKCKVHYSIQEKTYTEFYHFDDQTQVDKDNMTVLDFHFSVLGISDAHILLAPSSQVTKNDPVYEIVIGAGGNTFSDIRRKQKNSVRASIRMKGILSAVDIRSFWIHVYKDGTIDVGKEGEELGFLSWKDTDLLPLKVFSFSTWGNVEAKWFFDCPRGNKSTNSEKIEPVLTPLEQLRKNLLTDYNSYNRPVYDVQHTTRINMNLDVLYISLDEIKSTFHLKGTIDMAWADEKLIWDPDDYDRTPDMHVYHGEIWKPDILVSNSINMDKSELLNSRLIVVSFDGTVHWRSNFNSHTLCNLNNLLHWPNDVHTCTLEITPWPGVEGTQLIVKRFEMDSKYVGEWEILEVSFSEHMDTMFSQRGLKLEYKLRRNSDLYGRAFFTPFFVLAALMLLSFWSSPFGYIKITLACVQMLLTIIILIGISYKLPGHPTQVPFLVYLYSVTIIANIVCILIEIVVINLSRKDHCYAPPHYIMKILNLKCVEIMLLLPEGEVGGWYGQLNKETSFSKKSVQENWIRFTMAIDRLSFYVFLGVVMTPFFVKY